MPRELVSAPAAVVDAVVSEALLPCLRQLEAELGCVLPVSLSQWKEGPIGTATLVWASTHQSEGAAPDVGEARLSFRMNYGGDRYLFLLQARYRPEFAGHPTFSGFRVDGGVDMNGETPSRVQYSAWAVLWNDFAFSKWV